MTATDQAGSTGSEGHTYYFRARDNVGNEELWSSQPDTQTTVAFEAVDEDNLSGDGEVGVAIRNAPPEPAIVYPSWYVISDPHLTLEGVVRSAEPLTVRAWDGDTQVGETRSVGWNPTLGVNWQTVVTLTGEGLHPLSAAPPSSSCWTPNRRR